MLLTIDSKEPKSVIYDTDEVLKIVCDGITVWQKNVLYKMSDLYPDTYQTMETLPKQVVFNGKTARDMFYYCEKLKEIDTTKIDTSNTEDMSRMFYFCGSLTSLDLSGFDVSNVTKMNDIFHSVSLASLDLSKWKNSKLSDAWSMFRWCNYLTYVDISGIDMSKVTDGSGMFEDDKNLKTIKFHPNAFPNPTLKNGLRMFSNCSSLTSLDVSNWNVSSLENTHDMFRSCKSLTTLDVSKWKAKNLKDMTQMFWLCENLTSLDCSGFDTCNATKMYGVFGYCRKLSSVKGIFSLKSITESKQVEDMFASTKVTSVTFKDVPSAIKSEITTDLLGLPSTAKITIQNTI